MLELFNRASRGEGGQKGFPTHGFPLKTTWE